MKFNSFVFHRSYYEAIKCLDAEQQLHLYNAMFQYVFDKIKRVNLAEYEKGIFALIQPTIDTSLKKYETKVVNGKKGGAPKGNQNAKKSENNQKQPKNNRNSTENQPKNKQDKDKDKDKDLDLDYKKDTSFSKKQEKKDFKSIDEVLSEITNIDLKTNLQEFIKSRSSIKRPLTTYALELAIKHLKEIAKTESEQIEIIKRSIANGWLEFYPLTTERPKEESQFIHNNYDKAQLKEIMTDLDNVEV